MFKRIKEFFSNQNHWAKCECLIKLTISERMLSYDETIRNLLTLINKQNESIKKQEETIKKQSEKIDKLMDIHKLEFEIYDLHEEIWNLEHEKYRIQCDHESFLGRMQNNKNKLDNLQKKKYDMDYGTNHRKNSDSDGL